MMKKIGYSKDLEKMAQVFIEKIHMSKFGRAQARDEYISDIESIIQGAALEFYTCRIHDRLKENGTIKNDDKERSHWEKEWKAHLGPALWKQFIRKVKFSGTLSSKVRAFNEAMNDYLASSDRAYRTEAANKIANYFKLSATKTQKILQLSDAKDFLAEVKKALDYIETSLNEPDPFPKTPELTWNQKPKKQRKARKRMSNE